MVAHIPNLSSSKAKEELSWFKASLGHTAKEPILKLQLWNSRDKENHKHKSNLDPALIEVCGILKSYRNITKNLLESRDQTIPLKRKMRVIHSSPTPPWVTFPYYPDLFTIHSRCFLSSNSDFSKKKKKICATLFEIILALRN